MQNNSDRDPFEEERRRQEEIPKWSPYSEPQKQEIQKKQSRKLWLIPVIIVLVLMVASITVGLIFGAKKLSQMVRNSEAAAETDTVISEGTSDQATISTTNTSGIKEESSSGGYILTDVSDIVEEVLPSVVSITSRTLVENGGYGDYFNFFFGGYGNGGYGNGGYGNSGYGYDGSESQEVDSGLGSGTIISQDSDELLILTSYHVVDDCSSLYITFTDGQSVDGYVKSQSEADDIAIVAVPLTDIPEDTMNVIKIARFSTDPVEVGDGVIVIGNALGYGMSVTTGIISATDRQITADGKTLTVMQTDAAINSGNSGGCVLNRNGDIIGISEAKVMNSNVEGMCYAIPVSSNTELIQTLLNQEGAGKPEVAQDPGQGNDGQGVYLGIRGRDIDSALANSYGMPQGVYVAGTVAGSGAQEAGIVEGDIIVGMDNVSFTTMNQLQEQLAGHKPGDKVVLIIMREVDGNYTQVQVEVILTASIS